MKIYGTAKGGAISKKDFGVAFGGAAAGGCGSLLQEQDDTTSGEGYTDVFYTRELFETGNVNIGKTIKSVEVYLQKTQNSDNSPCTSCTLTGSAVVSFEGSASTSCGSLSGSNFCGEGTATGCSAGWFLFNNGGDCFEHTIVANDYLQVYWNHSYPPATDPFLSTYKGSSQTIANEDFQYSANGSSWNSRGTNMALKLYG